MCECTCPGMLQTSIDWRRRRRHRETGGRGREKREFHGVKRSAAVRRDSRDWTFRYVGRQKSWVNVGMARRNFPGRLTVVLNRAWQSDTSTPRLYIPHEIRPFSGRYIKKLRRRDGCIHRRRWILSNDNVAQNFRLEKLIVHLPHARKMHNERKNNCNYVNLIIIVNYFWCQLCVFFCKIIHIIIIIIII